ncbi:glycosyltransferase [Virgibacillus kekensis]|uniref:Glycosyltransferase n=1 Tax=Virgibacillus kekensis TaxID=202261 RepID=A0ABV9DGF5_9BACI
MSQKKALFLPFMQIPTGHHHVADALIELSNRYMDCSKVDILSYSFGPMEKVVSSAYLTWIRHFPGVYDRIYQFAAYRNSPKVSRHYLYELLFVHFFKRLTSVQSPHILFCTHALPSSIASVLKKKNQLNAIVVNVYTDFFINRVWGIEGIDYHLVATEAMKEHLVKRGVPPERIVMTGIPVHPAFNTRTLNKKTGDKLSVLVTGGSLGVGAIHQLVRACQSGKINYLVLCGKNSALYNQLKSAENPSIRPFPYIENKQDLNKIYDSVDGVLTKPGGVTVSECLIKRKPVFLYNPLPGQEMINAEELTRIGLARMVEVNSGLEQQIIGFFTDRAERKKHKINLDAYHEQLDSRPVNSVIEELIRKKH